MPKVKLEKPLFINGIMKKAGDIVEVDKHTSKDFLHRGVAKEAEQSISRADLEVKAKELCIDFKSNIGDKKLAELISAKEAEQ